jgi:hypothetical protein
VEFSGGILRYSTTSPAPKDEKKGRAASAMARIAQAGN